MKKKIGIAALALASLLLLSGIAAAQRYGMGFGMQGTFHEEMEEIMEEGTYNDLVAFREKTGFSMMPWVTDAETFKLAQERHDAMEKFHEENGYGPRIGAGMHGRGPGSGGCPMMG